MPPENALTDIRAEWVAESTTGEPPSDPSWNRFSDYFTSYPGWDGDAGVEGQPAVGRGDFVDHFRGPEEHTLTLEYWLQRFFTDSSGNVQDPAAVPLTHDYQTDYETHTVVIRRETSAGGNDGAGFREYVVGVGCRPTAVELPGDPAESQPIAEQLTYECEKVRQYVIHQPSSGTTLDISSDDADDTTQDITIEDEGAGTTETVTLSGTTAVTTTSSFSDIDAVRLSAETEGDVTITDGSGTTLLTISGKNATNIEGDLGVPLLGAGSHGSAIGTDPDDYLFLGTDATLGGSNIAQTPTDDRVHALDLSVEVETTVENRQGSGRPVIDIGTRTAQAEVEVAGPYESAAQNFDYYRADAADLVYTLPTGDVTLNNATRTNTDEVAREAGDANSIYGITLEAHGDPAVSVNNTA